SAANPFREGNKRESDAGRCAEERQCKQQIEDEKVQKLPRLPDHGERVERQPLGHGKAGDGRHREQDSASGKSGTDVAAQTVARDREECTTRTVAKQRNTDDHVREVMPLNDREEASQKHIEGESTSRHKRDSQEE